MTNKVVYAFFTASKTGKTGLTVTVDVDKIARADLTRTVVATGQAATELRDGFYAYLISSVDEITYDYSATFKTTDTSVDAQHLPALRTNQGLNTGDVYAALPSNFSVFALDANGRVDIAKIVGAAVNTALAQLGVNMVSQANIDFGALQKASLNAATPSVTVSDKTGFELSAAGILAIWNQLTADVGIVAGSFAAKLRDWVLGTDHKALISTDAQDVSATLSVNAKLLNGATPNNLAAGAQMDLVNAPNATAITAIQSGLATAAKLLSYFKSIFRNDVTADTDLGGTATSAADSLQAIQVSGISVTFPQSAANIISAVSGAKITAQPDTKWTFALTLPIAIDLTNYTSLLFTVKDDTTNTDAQALVQIEKNKSGMGDGLLYINAQTPTAAGVVAGDGSISITDSTHIVVTLNANAAALLAVQSNLIHYEVKQVVSATDATILSDGRNLFALVADVARAV